MKGILKTFEAVIGLILVMITFVVVFAVPDPLPEFDVISWKITGMDVLKSLDTSNQLRFDVSNNNTDVLESKIIQYMPPVVDILVQICSPDCTIPDIDAKKSASVHYLVSGDAGKSEEKEVIIYMWSDE